MKRTRLRPVSSKRAAERGQRAEVRRITLERAGGRCEGPGRGLEGECASPNPLRPVLETNETKARGTHPGSHLDASCTVALCQRHHDLLTNAVGEVRVHAEATGLIVRARGLDPVVNTKGHRPCA